MIFVDFDLVIIGNGIAAKTLLFELFKTLKASETNCQNFSVAQIFSNQHFPNCSEKSTATISLNGVDVGVSTLGDLLVEGYDEFCNFVYNNQPDGIELVDQYIISTDGDNDQKLSRRFNQLTSLDFKLLKNSHKGVLLKSFLLSPTIFNSWIDSRNSLHSFLQIEDVVKDVKTISAEHVLVELFGGKSIKSKYVVICSGAYFNILKNFNQDNLEFFSDSVVSGSYLVRDFFYDQSFFLTLNGHNVFYRNQDNKLIIGSSSQKGNFMLPRSNELCDILDYLTKHLNLDLGSLDQFKMITGLRHKGPKRLPICGFVDEKKKISVISGLYKNGYTLSFSMSKKMINLLLSQQCFSRMNLE